MQLVCRLGALRAWVAVLAALSCCVMAAPSTSLALSQRGHVFRFAFGEPGRGAGQLFEPAGVAVQDATGDVFVADPKNKGVEQFEPVLNESGGLIGESYVRSLPVPGASVAVDNSPEHTGGDPSRGDVYVVNRSGSAIYKFTGEGAAVGMPLRKFEVAEDGIRSTAKLEGIEGIAVDAASSLFVYEQSGMVLVFDDAEANEGVLSMPGCVSGPAAGAFALSSTDGLFVGVLGEGGLPEIAQLQAATCGLLIGALDREDTTAVAVNTQSVPANGVDERDDVYVTNVAEQGEVASSTVAQFAPIAEGVPGALIQRFGAAGLERAAGIAVDDHTGAVYVTDASSGNVYVFDLEPPGPPKIEDLSVISATPAASDARRLTAQVDPEGSATSYHFEYGRESCAVSACTLSATAQAGEGFTTRQASIELGGLAPGTYHFRVAAENASAEGSATVHSQEATFTILGVLAAPPDNRGYEMVSPAATHGATIGLLRSEGGMILASGDGDALTYVATGGAPTEGAEGDGAPEDQQVLSMRGESEWVSQDLATPNAVEKGEAAGHLPEYETFSSDLSLALVTPYGAISPPLLAPGVSEATSYLRADIPLEPGETERQSYQEARANSAFLAPGYLPLFPGEIHFEGATADLSHIVLSSAFALRGAGSGPGLYEWSTGGALTFLSSYEGAPVSQAALGYGGQTTANAMSQGGQRVIWSAPSGIAAHLYLTDTATGKTIRLDRAQGVTEPSSGAAFFQTASPDGSKVFFLDGEKLTAGATAEQEHHDLYVCEITESAGQPSCRLSDLTTGVAKAGELASVRGLMLGASENGTSVYLVAQGVLAANVNASGERAQSGQDNLYQIHEAGGTWATTFIATLSPNDSAGWGDLITGQRSLTARVSPNGRYLAFMSERQLTGYDNEDLSPAADGAHDEEVFLYDSVSQSLTCVSCNVTGERPTGVWDNVKSGEGIGLVVDRTGTWNHNGNGGWLAGNIPGWTAEDTRALADPRYLSNEGRLFFDGAGPVLPAVNDTTRQEEVEEQVEGKKQLVKAQVGVENVYEYEPAGLGSCSQDATAGCLALISAGSSDRESAFLEATASGEDAFFLSAAKLLPQDTEGGLAIYDARVCTQASPCLTAPSTPPHACETAAECHPASFTPAPPFEATGSASFSGAGNLTPVRAGQGANPRQGVNGQTTGKTPTRAQKLAKALAACKKQHQHSKSKRKACEAHARRLYAPKRDTKTSTKTRRSAGDTYARR